MDITLDRQALSEALTISGRLITPKASRLAGGVLLRTTDQPGLKIVSTDLTSVFSTSIEGNVPQQGEVVVSGKWLQEVVKVVGTEEVRLVEKSGDSTLEIKAGNTRFILRTIPLESFPHVTTELEGETTRVTVKKREFEQAVSQVVVAAGTDEARPVFTGCLIDAREEVKLVATDSYRLAERSLRTDVKGEARRVVVSARVLEEVSRLKFEGADDSITLELGDDSAALEVGQHRLKTRYIEGTFPEYERLIPLNNESRCIAGKHELLDTIKRVSVLAREATPVKLSLTRDGVTVEVKDAEVGEATDIVESAVYTGEDLEIAFNPKYLIDSIGACEGEKVELEIKDSLSAVLVHGEDREGYRHLVMPIRL